MIWFQSLEDYVVYSSFNHDSIGLIKQIKADAEVAYLAGDYHRCMDGIGKYGGMTIHPAQWGMPINKGDVETIRNAGLCVRMWNGSEPLYGQLRTAIESSRSLSSVCILISFDNLFQKEKISIEFLKQKSSTEAVSSK